MVVMNQTRNGRRFCAISDKTDPDWGFIGEDIQYGGESQKGMESGSNPCVILPFMTLLLIIVEWYGVHFDPITNWPVTECQKECQSSLKV